MKNKQINEKKKCLCKDVVNVPRANSMELTELIFIKLSNHSFSYFITRNFTGWHNLSFYKKHSKPLNMSLTFYILLTFTSCNIKHALRL